MRVLVTGINGFVGGHLARALAERGDALIGIDRSETSFADEYRCCALDDIAAVHRILSETAPDSIVHLAGTRNPADVQKTNVLGTSVLLDAVAEHARPIRVVIVGSSAMYGNSSDRAPLTEDAAVQPATPYGSSKAAADLLAQEVFALKGLPIMRARPFNIIGPCQRGDYVTAVCAMQLVRIERGLQPPIVKLGSLDAYRDFLDVRDLVRGLLAIIERGQPGEAYNVCSGASVSIRAIVDKLCSLIANPVTVESSPPRADDVPFQIGSFAKLRAHTGWSPQIALEQSLHDILDDWRRD